MWQHYQKIAPTYWGHSSRLSAAGAQSSFVLPVIEYASVILNQNFAIDRQKLERSYIPGLALTASKNPRQKNYIPLIARLILLNLHSLESRRLLHLASTILRSFRDSFTALNYRKSSTPPSDQPADQTISTIWRPSATQKVQLIWQLMFFNWNFKIIFAKIKIWLIHHHRPFALFNIISIKY